PATGVIPGWQLTLMAVTVVLLAAVLVTIAYPGPGRPAAAERTHPPSDDDLPRHADPQEQPAALARPIPARQNHRAGPRPCERDHHVRYLAPPPPARPPWLRRADHPRHRGHYERSHRPALARSHGEAAHGRRRPGD